MIDSVKPTARIPAVQGQFGSRLATYTTQLPPGAIETVLGHDPRSKHWKKLPDDIGDVYEHMQRATTKSRLDSIIRYIRYRFLDTAVIAGAFPAISVAVQHPTPFQHVEGADRGIGVLDFDLSRRNRRMVVDGLGRASAVLELVEISESMDLLSENREALKKLLSEFTLPTVLYVPMPGTEPLTLEEMQQLFHDFNFRVTPVPQRIAIALDHSNLYIALTNKIGKSELITSFGGMESRSASLGKKSTAIVVQQNLLRFVRGATEGELFLEATNNRDLSTPNLNEESLTQFQEAIHRFLLNFSEAMGEQKFRDRESLHLTSPGWGALGIIYHDLAVTLKSSDIDKAARQIGSINWHRSAPEWRDIVRKKTDQDGNEGLGLAGGGAQNRRFITKLLREKLGIDKQIPERDSHSDDPAVAA